MKALIWVALAVVLVSGRVSPVAAADEAGTITVRSGFITGAGFLELSESEQSVYAMGVVDGLLLSPLFGAPDKGGAFRLAECLVGLSGKQVAAMVKKFLDENPKRWLEDAHILVYGALLEPCKLGSSK